jgi:hypothetical protein
MRRLVVAVGILGGGLTAVTATTPSAQAAICTPGTLCVDVDGTTNLGPAVRRAQGLLQGLTPGMDLAALDDLHLQNLRTSVDQDIAPVGGTGFPTSMYELAKARGAGVTFVISDYWWRNHNNPVVWGGDGRQPPWLDGFMAYDAMVKELVQNSITSGKHVDWWDVLNEPQNDCGPTDPAAANDPTKGRYTDWCNKELYLEEYKHAHDAIRSVDPNAKIVGPSLGEFDSEPNPVAILPTACTSYRASRFLDLSTFIDYAKSNNLRFDALSWHELGMEPCEQGFMSSPSVIDGHVARARQLLDSAGMTSTQIHVNEYGPRPFALNPGWIAGIIAHLDSSNVAVANQSCWDVHNDGTPTYSSCYSGQDSNGDEGAADGLFLRDGWTKRSTYWVHHRYGAMTGNRNAVALSDPQGMSAFATYDGTKHKVLVARHVGCHVAIDSNCDLASNKTPAPTTGGVVRVRVSGTATSVPVTVDRIPDVGALAAPIVDLSTTLPVVGGIVSVSLPAIADGDAYAISVG